MYGGIWTQVWDDLTLINNYALNLTSETDLLDTFLGYVLRSGDFETANFYINNQDSV